MRRKTITLCVVAMAAVILLAITAMPASAKPSFSNSCAGCHSTSPAVSVSVSESSKGATETTYSFTISGDNAGSYGFGVFDASGAKVAGGSNATGSFNVGNGGSYTFYGVNKVSGSMQGSASTTLNPTAPVIPPPSSTPPPSPSPSLVPLPDPVAADWRIRGTLESINGNIWQISGISITVNMTPTVKGGVPVVGSRVKAKGSIAPDGVLLGEKVHVKLPKASNPEAGEDEEETPKAKPASKGASSKPSKESEAKEAQAQVGKDNERKHEVEKQRDTSRDQVRSEKKEVERKQEFEKQRESGRDADRNRDKKTEK